MSKETVEEYLARGGEITEVPFGVSGDKKIMLIANGNTSRARYADPEQKAWNKTYEINKMKGKI